MAWQKNPGRGGLRTGAFSLKEEEEEIKGLRIEEKEGNHFKWGR